MAGAARVRAGPRMRDRAAALRAGTVPQSANWAASVCYARRAFGHRADIDGLRAVAVVPVLLFHAGFPAFAGGFVGVDVFFVISGYLITSIILDETDAGRFSIVAFYERRIRRIFPALFAMLFASSILGALVLLPDDLKNLGQSSAAAALSASNFLFWHELGYFDVAAELKPLLHTWSLAVEEQFYVVFPIALLLLLRAHKSGALLILATVALLSFVLAEWGPSPMAFYLAPARAWELLLGALLATGAVPPPGRQWVRDSLSLLGLGLIAWSVLALSSATPFPGMAALLPTLGAALVIHAGDGGQSLAGRVLGVRPLVLAGLISYSLYLWHWPLLVFARTYVGRELSMAETLAVLALSVAVAVASWRWIERPFRGSRPILARPKLFAAAGAAVSVTVAIGLGLHLAEGLPTRLPPDAARLAAGARDRAIAPPECVNPPLEAVREGRLCRIGAARTTPADVCSLGRLACRDARHRHKRCRGTERPSRPLRRLAGVPTAFGCKCPGAGWGHPGTLPRGQRGCPRPRPAGQKCRHCSPRGPLVFVCNRGAPRAGYERPSMARRYVGRTRDVPDTRGHLSPRPRAHRCGTCSRRKAGHRCGAGPGGQLLCSLVAGAGGLARTIRRYQANRAGVRGAQSHFTLGAGRVGRAGPGEDHLPGGRPVRRGPVPG